MNYAGVLAEIEARALAMHLVSSTDDEDLSRRIQLQASATHRELHRVAAFPFSLSVLGKHRDRLLDLAALVLRAITELDKHVAGRPKEN